MVQYPIKSGTRHLGDVPGILLRRYWLLALSLPILAAVVQAEPAAAPGGKTVDELFAEDEMKDVEFRFRTRFPRELRPVEEQRVLIAYKISPDEAPTIDGKISRTEVWTKNRIDQPNLAPAEVRVDRTNDTWVQVITGTANRRQTVVYACYDDEKIYFCFVCEEPDSRATRMESRPAHDVWWDDCIEALFEIGDVNGSGQRFHFLANLADRTQYANNSPWDMSDWDWKGEWGAKCWVVEMAVPFRNFAIGEYRYPGPPVRGELWGLKLCREGSPVVEGGQERMYSVWEFIPILDFTLPEYSGMLVFQDRNALRNEDLKGDEDGDGAPDAWQVLKSGTEVEATLKRQDDGTPVFQFQVREKIEAAAVAQRFQVRSETFYRVRADIEVERLEGEAFIEIHEAGEEPIRRVQIPAQGRQTFDFEFRADRDKTLYFAVASHGGKGSLRIRQARIEQELFTVPEGVYCLTNNSARKDIRMSSVVQKLNAERQKANQPHLPYEEGAYTYRFVDTSEEHFPRKEPCHRIPYDKDHAGIPEKEVQSGWVPFNKGSLTEGRGKDDKSMVFYPGSLRFGSEVPEGVDVVFDLKQNFYLQMIEVYPMTGGMNGLEIYVKPDKSSREYLIWKMNGPGVLNPVREMMIAKVRPLDSVTRTVRLSIRHKAQFSLKEVCLWGRFQESHPDTEIRHFRWKDGIVMPPKTYEQVPAVRRPFIFPFPREFQEEEGVLELKPGMAIIHAENDQDRRTAEILARDLEDRGVRPRLVPEGAAGTVPPGSLWLGSAPSSPAVAARLSRLGTTVTPDSPGPEGYALIVRPGEAVLAGSDPAGTIYARDTFMQILAGNPSTGLRAPAVTIRDWPNVSIRAAHMIYVGLDSAAKSDAEIERILRLYCRCRFNTIYLTHIYSPGRRRLAADYNITVVSGVGTGGAGPATEVATDETYAHVTSIQFHNGRRANPDPSFPPNAYAYQNRIYDLLHDPLSRFNHIGHDEMTWTTAGSRWNECRRCQLRQKKGGDLFAELILREHDMLKRVQRDTVVLNTVLTTRGAQDKDEYAQMNRAYPLIARDITMDNYLFGNGRYSDPFYSNTSGFERTVYIWRRPKPGEYWNHEVTGYWMANWNVMSLDSLLEDFFGSSGYWATRGLLESQFSWNPYEELVQRQPNRSDVRIGSYDQILALSTIRSSECLQGYAFPSWRADARTVFQAIDIRPFLNWSHIDEAILDRRGWVDKGTNYDLRRLPRGRVEFAGIPFDLLDPAQNQGQSIVLLQSPGEDDEIWPGAHRQVRVPIGRRVASLIFLRTTMEGGGLPPVYEAHYDGGFQVLPMVFTGWNAGESLRAATRRGVWPVWLGDAPCGDPIVLYACEWVNPYPDQAVREISIRFPGPGRRHAEALFAVTACEVSEADTAFWTNRDERLPFLTLARSGVDGFPEPTTRTVYGQQFTFVERQPPKGKSLGKESVQVVSARAFDAASGQYTMPTRDGFVVPVYNQWSGPFKRSPDAKAGGTFEVTLQAAVTARAFTLSADNLYQLTLSARSGNGAWKVLGQGLGHGAAGSLGLAFPQPETFDSFRIQLETGQIVHEPRLYHFAFHE